MRLTELPWQYEQRLNSLRNNIIIGGRGVGKSKYVRNDALLSVINFPHIVQPDQRPIIAILMEDSVNSKSIHFKPLYDFLSNSEWFKLIDDINIVEKRFRFKNIDGKILPDIVIGGAGKDGLGDNWRGNSFYKVYLDEGADLSHIDYLIDEIFEPRLDFGDSSITIISTPKGQGTDLHNLYIKYENSPNCRAVHLTSYDNPTNSRKKLDELKLSLPPRAYRQEVLASWEAFAGQIFESFNKDTHTTSSELYKTRVDGKPLKTNYYVGLDLGSTNTAYVVVRLDIFSDRKIFTTLENNWYNSITTVDQLSEDIISLNEKYRFSAIVVPDDRADIVMSFRNKGLRKAIVAPRNSDGIRPAHRTATMDNLFYTGSLFLTEEPKTKELSLIDEIGSFRRVTSPSGEVLDKIDPKCVQHRIDALGYAIGAVTKGIS
jgi:hypothetical protein